MSRKQKIEKYLVVLDNMLLEAATCTERENRLDVLNKQYCLSKNSFLCYQVNSQMLSK